MSAAVDSSVSVSNEVMSLSLPALLPGIGEASLAAIAFANSSGDAGTPLILVDQQLARF